MVPCVTSYSQDRGRIHVQVNTSYTISISEDVSTKHAIILAQTVVMCALQVKAWMLMVTPTENI